MWDILLLLYINTAPLSLKINKSQRHLFGAVHLFMLRLPLHPWNGLQYNIDIHQYAITAAVFGTVLGHHPIIRNHFTLICVKIISIDELIEKKDYCKRSRTLMMFSLIFNNFIQEEHVLKIELCWFLVVFSYDSNNILILQSDVGVFIRVKMV